MTKALAGHPKLIKMKDRVNHANNTLIIGIQENSKEEQEDTMAKVHELLDTKLGMKANMTQERRLGKDKQVQANQDQSWSISAQLRKERSHEQKEATGLDQHLRKS